MNRPRAFCAFGTRVGSANPGHPRGTAEELGRLVRWHWSVENELHWTLDVTFGEDANRTAADHAGANLGLIRRVAASLL